MDEVKRLKYKNDVSCIINQLLLRHMTVMDAVKCILMIIDEAMKDEENNQRLSK